MSKGTIATGQRWLLLLLALVLVVAACASDDTEAVQAEADPVDDPTEDGDEGDDAESEEEVEEDPLAELIAAAEEEGQVMLYSAWPEGPTEAVAQGFEDAYDISLDFIRLAAGALNQRFLEEFDARVYEADVIVHSVVQVYRDDEAENGDMFTPLAEAGLPLYDEWPDDFKSERTIGPGITPMVLGYNRDAVAEDELPDTWDAFADPEWAGRIALADPRGAPGTTWWFLMMEQEMGTEWLEALAANDVTIVESVGPATQQVAAGEFDVVIPTNAAHAVGLTEVVGLRDMQWSSGWEVEMALPANAPNPNAARLLYHWLMTEDGQTAVNGGEANRVSPMYEGLPGTVPMAAQYIPPDTIGAAEEQDRITAIFGLD